MNTLKKENNRRLNQSSNQIVLSAVELHLTHVQVILILPFPLWLEMARRGCGAFLGLEITSFWSSQRWQIVCTGSLRSDVKQNSYSYSPCELKISHILAGFFSSWVVSLVLRILVVQKENRKTWSEIWHFWAWKSELETTELQVSVLGLCSLKGFCTLGCT